MTIGVDGAGEGVNKANAVPAIADRLKVERSLVIEAGKAVKQ
jgi:hypothetical protein